jgi:hypothetical protein
MSRPYRDIFSSNNTIIREFGDDIDPIELMWHRDLKSRIITVLEGQDWFFQHNNCIPVRLETNTYIFIQEQTYHRLIKGQGKLILQIQEL